MFCKMCGTQNDDAVIFCKHCGFKIGVLQSQVNENHVDRQETTPKSDFHSNTMPVTSNKNFFYGMIAGGAVLLVLVIGIGIGASINTSSYQSSTQSRYVNEMTRNSAQQKTNKTEQNTVVEEQSYVDDTITEEITESSITFMVCTTCGGTGRKQTLCTKCSGSPKTVCTLCHGAGNFYNGTRYTTCGSCAGRGYRNCTWCGGSGYKEDLCGVCGGTGQIMIR